MWQRQRMPFGKHKHKLICDLPRSYLKWLIGADADEWIKQEARKALQEQGSRFILASEVLDSIENRLEELVIDDVRIEHEIAGIVGDHLLQTFDEVRDEFGVRDRTELVVHGKRTVYQEPPGPGGEW